MKDDYDGAEPSANSVSALNLIRLARLLNEDGFEKQAEKILQAHAMQMERAPTAVPQMLVALDLFLKPPQHFVVVGELMKARPILDPLAGSFLPHAARIVLDAPQDAEFFGKNAPALRGMKPGPDGPLLYRCENFVCQAPVSRI